MKCMGELSQLPQAKLDRIVQLVSYSIIAALVGVFL